MGFTWTEQRLNGRTVSCSQQEFKMRHWTTKSHLTKRGDIAQDRLWALPWTEKAAEMTEQVQNKPWIRHWNRINQAGHLSKIFRFACWFSECRNHIQSANLIIFSPGKQKEEGNKILDKLNKAICSVDQSQPFRFACRRGPCNQSRPLASQAAGSHGNLEMEASRVGVVGGIKWRRNRMLPAHPLL